MQGVIIQERKWEDTLHPTDENDSPFCFEVGHRCAINTMTRVMRALA